MKVDLANLERPAVFPGQWIDATHKEATDAGCDTCGWEETGPYGEVRTRWEIRDGDYGEGDVMYQVCRECCAAGGGGQTEECASDHSLPCWPCGTVQAISRALLSKEG